jgi:hypothetical protein
MPTMDKELVGSTTLGGRRDVSRLDFNRDGFGMRGSFWVSVRCGVGGVAGVEGGRGIAAEALRLGDMRDGVRRISSTEGWVRPIILWDEGWQERSGVIVRVSYRLLWSMGWRSKGCIGVYGQLINEQ